MPGKEQSAIKSCALSSRLYITSRAAPQEDHSPIIPQSSRPLRCTLMEQMNWRLAPGAPHTLPLPHIWLLCLVYFLYLSPRPVIAWLPLSISPVFQHCGRAVYKSHVLSLRRAAAPLRQPALWFSLQLMSCRVILCMSVPMSVAHNFGHGEFSSQPWTFYCLFMRENGIKSVRYRLEFFWPSTLFSLAAALKVC